MESWEAALLGAVQGATEFLPISSSGHLRLGALLLGLKEPSLLFDIILHVGTLLAVVAVLRHDIVRLVLGSLRGLRLLAAGERGRAWAIPELRWAAFIVVGTIPTGLLGVGLGHTLDGALNTPGRVGAVLILNGFVLLATRWAARRAARADRPPRPLSWKVALLVGTAQGLAVARGISRSGSTIAAALFASVERKDAARFSFLLSIPAILGALVLELKPEAFAQGGVGAGAYAIGLLVSAGVGVLCLRFLLYVVQHQRLHHFAWYCWAVGLAAILWEVL